MATKSPLAEMLIAVVGSVDAGKSTFCGVMSRDDGVLDDGKGKARLFTVPLKHEVETQRTSSVNMVNVLAHGRTLRLIDLAGHEKYLKTTLKGLNQYFPNYALLLVNAHKSVLPMTREHMSICKSLNIPVIILITKVDDCPAEVLMETIKKVKKFFKSYGRRFVSELKTKNDAAKYTSLMAKSPHVLGAYVLTSNVSGQGLPMVRHVLSTLPVLPTVSTAITTYIEKKNLNQLFYVFTPFQVPGVGLILYGRNYGATISKGVKLNVGPFNGKFIEVRVRSIHNKLREPVDTLASHQLGCLAIKPTNAKVKLTKEMLKEGKVATDEPDMAAHVSRELIGSLFVHAHPTTIRKGYEPFLHCGNVRTSTKLLKSSILPLRMGNRADVVFKLKTPSMIYPGMPFLFRDNRIKASGVVSNKI